MLAPSPPCAQFHHARLRAGTPPEASAVSSLLSLATRMACCEELAEAAIVARATYVGNGEAPDMVTWVQTDP